MAGLFIPGIVGILGQQGAGKSYAAIKIGCQYANQIQFDLCFNFPVNLVNLWRYCVKMGYDWLASRIYHNHVICRSSNDLKSFMEQDKCIYILDEAGVYLNSRKFMSLDTSFLHDLAQIRHDGRMLWWIAQYYEMSDKLLRNLSSAFILCDSQQRFNKKLGNSELWWQRIYLYNSRNFRIFNSRVADKLTGPKYLINARRLADFHWEGLLDNLDKMVFNTYQSFGNRVDATISDVPSFSSTSYIRVTEVCWSVEYNICLGISFKLWLLLNPFFQALVLIDTHSISSADLYSPIDLEKATVTAKQLNYSNSKSVPAYFG